MARRRKEDDLGSIVAQLVGLVLLVGIVGFGTRGGVNAATGIVLLLGIILGLGLVGAFLLHRFNTRAERLQFASPATYARQSVALPQFNPPPQVARHDSPARPRLPDKVELVQQLRSVDWFQFEKIVALAYRKQGYTVTRRGGAHPDGGIDLLISKDGETKAVQCKQWKTWKLGVKTVREFLGALADAQLQHGTIIGLCGSTFAAQALAAKHGIALLNETDLATLLERGGVCSDPEAMAILNDRRKLCPKCEREMVLRTAKTSRHQFWGCSAYPRCRFTMPLAG